MDDLKSRLANRVQLTSDGHNAYLRAVEEAFGADAAYAQIRGSGLQRPLQPSGVHWMRAAPGPGLADPKHISTSFAERQNLTMRMHMRRFKPLTNACSKKVENHVHSLALFTTYYNFVRCIRSCA
jgi:hypothetical protein